MQAIVSVHCFVPPDLSYPKDINDQIVKYLMIACYLPKKQSLLLPKIIIFISALHAFTLFLKPKPHTSSNVVANVRQVWVLGIIYYQSHRPTLTKFAIKFGYNSLHYFSALAAFCVLYNRTQLSQDFSSFYIKFSKLLEVGRQKLKKRNYTRFMHLIFHDNFS